MSPSATAQEPVTGRAAQAAETRRRLIEAAVALFSDRTFEEVAVADIAKSAGVAHGLLFHYFGSKRGIYLEAMREAATQLDAAFRLDPALPPTLQLREALTSHLQYLSAHRGLALRLILGGRGADPEAWKVFDTARAHALDTTLSVLGLDPSNPALLMMARAAVAGIDEATVIWLNDSQPFEIEAVVDSMIALMAAGLEAASVLDPSIALKNRLSP